MKICYLADGTSIHTQRWVKYFADTGHEVHLISPRLFDDNDLGNVKFHQLKKLQPQIRIISFPINLLFDIIQVKRLLNEINPDILHAHYVAEYGIIGALTGFRPFMVSAWGSDILIEPETSKVIKVLVKFALKQADLITCSGEHLREAVIILGTTSQKTELIYHGADTKKFKPGEKDRNLIENLSILDSPTVISTRGFKPVYDVETLIKSIPLIIKKIPDTRFIIAGRGPQENYLKTLARSLGILDNIRFVGWIAHNEVPKYLLLADVYVSTSLSDGASISLLEAMSGGLSPVVTDIPANRELIIDGENGFLFKMKDSSSLANKIIYLLENENITKRFGIINRKIIEERADYYKEMLKMEKLYKKLIGG